MRCLRPFRSSIAAFSTVYGAFAVVLVSTVVVGVILASPPSRLHVDERDRALADGFVDALLASTLENSSLPISQALSSACLAARCSPGLVTIESVRANLSRLAFPLAKALDRRFDLRLENETGPLFVLGDLPSLHSATASRAAVYHGPTGTYLTLTVALGRT